MSLPPDPTSPDPSAGRDGPGDGGGLEELRALLVGPEREQLSDLVSRLEDPRTRAREVGSVLPEAIALRGDDPALTKALAPSVEQAITASVRRNPRPLSDALFPVMGPAIRKAIAHALSAMVESLNQALEQSLSWKSLRWRLEAWRTRRPFSEVVLLKTLLYRVEQVFLIHRESGLLLQHAAAAPAAAQDADMVSGMLTAIRDFARDSFGVGEQESLEELQVGGLRVWVEQGPKSMLAAVLRGNPPREYRSSLQQALESISLQHAEALDSFTGDTQPFEIVRPILESCLDARYIAPEEKSRFRGARLLAVALLALAALWIFFLVAEGFRWRRYMRRLRSEPGIVVISSGRSGWRRSVEGLRDPVAADPVRIASEAGYDPRDIEAHWEPYQALDPRLALQRARQLLAPPPSVTLLFEGGTLSVSGEASPEWASEARRLARLVGGVTRYNDSALSGAVFTGLQGEINASQPQFVKGEVEFASGQEDVVTGLIERFRRLNELARSEGRRIAVRVIGHTDSDGSVETNESLSRRRAEVFRQLLLGRGLDMLDITTDGAGSSRPLGPGRTQEEKQRNRRVSFEWK